MPAYNGGITDSTDEIPVVYMKINDGVVLGLHELFLCLKKITPSKDNKKEWEAVRHNIFLSFFWIFISNHQSRQQRAHPVVDPQLYHRDGR